MYVGDRQQPTEVFQDVLQHEGQQDHEEGAEDGAQDAAQAADDDHGQQLDGACDLEGLDVGRPHVVDVEGAGHPGVEGADHEGHQLVTEDVHADDLGGHVAVADGHEGPPQAAAGDVQAHRDGQHRHRQDQVILLDLGVEAHRPQADGRYDDAGLEATAYPLHVVDDPLGDELGGQGGDGQIEALHPQRGQPHDEAVNGSEDSPGYEPHPEGHVGAGGHDGGRVAPGGHEGGVADGYLAGEARKQVQADGRHQRDAHEVEPQQVLGVHHEGHHQREQQEEGGHADAGQRHRIQGHVRLVGGPEDAALAVDHGPTPAR